MAMMRSAKVTWVGVLTVSLVLLLCFSLSAHAAPGVKGVRPMLFKKLLSAAGVEAEVTVLDRGDGFGKAIRVEGAQGATVTIGFPKAGIRRGRPFLLSVDGAEALVEVSEGGVLSVIDGRDDLIPAGILAFVECIVDAAVAMAEEIDSCDIDIFCILEAVFDGVAGIVTCVEDLL
jgi:hypothetical protein